jgi:hypothetical protein
MTVIYAWRAFVLKGILDRDGVDAARAAARVIHRYEEEPLFRQAMDRLIEISEGDPERAWEILDGLKAEGK